MGRSFLLTSFVAIVAAGAIFSAPARAQDASPLSGVWALNRSLSEFPQDIGFNMPWMPAQSGGGQSTGSSAGGRGRRGSGGGSTAGAGRGSTGPSTPRPESYDDAQRVQLLTREGRTPPARLLILDKSSAVTMTNEFGQSRTLHPNGKDESIDVQGVQFIVNTKRDGADLVVLYHAEQDREVRYTYSYTPKPSQLVVSVQFLEHGAGETVRRVYEPALETDAPVATASTATNTSPGGGPTPPASASDAKSPASAGPRPSAAIDQRPGAELRGLKNLGIVVEELSAQAAACGLTHDAIEKAVSTRLTDGGFVVRRNSSNDDAYVYVNINTSSLSNGLCVSRYDVFLNTNATATLSYHDQPVLVQASLGHRGGINGGAPTTHGATVMHDLENFVDLFVTEIHDANK